MVVANQTRAGILSIVVSDSNTPSITIPVSDFEDQIKEFVFVVFKIASRSDVYPYSHYSMLA